MTDSEQDRKDADDKEEKLSKLEDKSPKKLTAEEKRALKIADKKFNHQVLDATAFDQEAVAQRK